jgi:WD40 repeat protein
VLLSGGAEGIYIWDVIAEQTTKRIETAPPAVSGTSYAEGHESDIETFAWAYGCVLITGSRDNNIKCWNALRDFKEMETIFGHKAAVLAVVVQDSKHQMATAGRDSTIKVWDISTLQPEMHEKRDDDSGVRCNLTCNLDGHRGDVTSLAWGKANPDTLYSGARDNTIKMWDVLAQLELRDVEDTNAGTSGKHRGDVRTIIVLPCPVGVQLAPKGSVIPPNAPPGAEGGDILLTGSLDSCMKVWSLMPHDTDDIASAAAVLASLESTTEEGGGAAAPAPMARAPDASTVGGDWDDNTDAILEQILHGGSTADALLGSTDAPDRVCFTVPAFTDEGVHTMAVSPAGPVMAVASADNAVVLMNISGVFGGHVQPMQAFQGHNAYVGEVELLEDDLSVLTASADNFVARFNVESTEVALRIKFGSAVQAIGTGVTSNGAATAGGQGTLPAPFMFAGGADYVIRAYSSNMADYGPIETALAQQWAKAGHSGPTKVPPHQYVCARYEGHVGRIESIAISEAGDTMVSGARDFQILVWDLKGKQCPSVPTAPREEYSVPVHTPSARIEAHVGHVTDLRFSFTASEALLASGGNDHAVKVWKIKRGLLGQSISKVWQNEPGNDGCHTGAVSAVTWGKNASGNTMFSAGWDKVIKVWDGSTGRLLKTLPGHTSRVTDLDTSKGGELVVSVSADFTARVWSTADPFSCMARYATLTGDGGLSAVSAGIKKFVTASDSGVLRVWALPGDAEYAHLFKEDDGQEVKGAIVALNVATGGAAKLPAVLGGSGAVGGGAGPPSLPGMADTAGPAFPTTGGYADMPAADAGWKQEAVSDADGFHS